MADCELLNDCALFKKFEKSRVVTCRELIAEYCRGMRQNKCKRREYLLNHKTLPPENMLPGGSLIRMDAEVFFQINDAED